MRSGSAEETRRLGERLAEELRPGDVILTGTPVGSALLSPGDVVESQIDGIGLLVNPVRAQAV